MKNNDIVLQPVDIIELFDIAPEQVDNLERINARKLWEETNQGSGVVVGVIDSGIETNHPSLKDNVIGGYNFTDDDNANTNIFEDGNGHGTHVAGIIAASNISGGMSGVAPKAKLLILKAISADGRGSTSNLIKAINYAANWIGSTGETVNVINMSLGGPKENEDLHKAIKYAHSKGIVLVAASGNEGDGKGETIEISFPGFYKEVIQVGSVSARDNLSRFSNSNVNLDFVGPGEKILSTHLNGSYARLSGTSMASSFVAGSAALIIKLINRATPKLIPALVYDYLLIHAKKIENYSIKEIGNGFISLK